MYKLTLEQCWGWGRGPPRGPQSCVTAVDPLRLPSPSHGTTEVGNAWVI